MREPQQVLEVDAHPVTGIRPFVLFFREALGLVKDVRVIPIDKNLVHPVFPFLFRSYSSVHAMRDESIESSG